MPGESEKCQPCAAWLSGLSDNIHCITHNCGPNDPCGQPDCPHCQGLIPQSRPTKPQIIGAALPPDSALRQDITGRLKVAQGASCNCLTKSPLPEHHDVFCSYRILNDAEREIEKLRSEKASLTVPVVPDDKEGDRAFRQFYLAVVKEQNRRLQRRMVEEVYMGKRK